MMIKEWRVAQTGNHQGLIIDADGKNIAVSYDKEDAPLIAAAPKLLSVCKSALMVLQRKPSIKGYDLDIYAFLRDAIAEAKGDDL